MDSRIKEVVNYLSFQRIDNTPVRKLSIARVIYMVYLSDWKSALEQGRQLTSIKWNGLLEVPADQYEIIKETIKEDEKLKEFVTLSETDKKILDHVIESVADLSWFKVQEIANSTYPLFKYTDNQKLDLLQLAKEKKEMAERKLVS